LQIPESDPAQAVPTETSLFEALSKETRFGILSTPVPLAPAWHTLLLIGGIVVLSVGGSSQMHHVSSRLLTYGTTAALELVMLGWVALGLWLRKIPFRALFGASTWTFRGIAFDLGIACVFWIGALMVLASVGAVWAGTEYAVAHRHSTAHAGQLMEPNSAEKQNVRILEQLAPASGVEIACWVLLCCLAGTIEEVVFRGYLQQQFTAWTKGGVVGAWCSRQVVRRSAWIPGNTQHGFACGVRSALQRASNFAPQSSRWNFCAQLARSDRGIDARIPSRASPYLKISRDSRWSIEKIVASFSTRMSFFA
jgi:membrane protease YdiL (CAAX protease family)